MKRVIVRDSIRLDEFVEAIQFSKKIHLMKRKSKNRDVQYFLCEGRGDYLKRIGGARGGRVVHNVRERVHLYEVVNLLKSRIRNVGIKWDRLEAIQEPTQGTQKEAQSSRTIDEPRRAQHTANASYAA